MACLFTRPLDACIPLPQAREAREKEEASLDHKRRMVEYEEANAAQLAALRRERDALEDELRQQVGRQCTRGKRSGRGVQIWNPANLLQKN